MDLPSAPSNDSGDSSNKPPLGEPSKARRETLKKHNDLAPITLQNLCPISKYYAAADIVLEQFKELLKKRDVDGAYVIGLRFIMFSTVSLPGHIDYTSPKPDLLQLRLKNQRDVHWVTGGLETIVRFMDKQEIEKQNAELERIRGQKEEEEREKMEWEQKMKQRSVAKKQQQPKSPLLYDVSKYTTIDRIREVFPLVSRQKVHSFLDKASSYVDDKGDEAVMMQIVMIVLSEHPLGESIPEGAFAAAAVGGHSDATTVSKRCNDDDDGKAATGKRKIALLECNCCFVDYPFEEMVSCRSAGHLFCKTCLQKHTEQRVFGLGNLGVVKNGNNNGSTNNNHNNNGTLNNDSSKALEILCMHSSGCTSGFHEWQLRKALSEKVLKKYDEMQYAAVIEQANSATGDISRCPTCNFIAFAEKTVTTFHCPQCSFKSCRECGDEAHPGINCDEVETKKETDGRTNVEEAMTLALVRTCPRPFCRKKFLKTDGCNKMTCACGAYVCYVCRQEIPKNVAYAHFCQTPHCNHRSCGKCALFADVEKEDEKRVKEAAKKAAKEQKTDVDVESLLKNPNPPTAAAAAARGGGGGGRGNRGRRRWSLTWRRAQRQHQQGGRGGGNNDRRRNEEEGDELFTMMNLELV